MKMESEITYKGKKYVTRKEFCKRIGISETTIRRYIASGHVREEKINDMSYVDFDYSRREVANMPDKKGRRKHLKNYAQIAKNAEIKPVSEPGIADASVPEEKQVEMLDLSQFNKDDYSDCVVDGQFDYDKLKTRITAETYKFKLEKERGLHIPKADILDWSKTLATILKTNVDAVPSRFAAILIATAEKITNYEFTEEERTEVRNALKKVPAQIMLSIQTEMRKYADE